jgi:hypothetical protein
LEPLADVTRARLAPSRAGIIFVRCQSHSKIPASSGAPKWSVAVSDYSKIKQTPEYREARQDVQSMIDRALQDKAGLREHRVLVVTVSEIGDDMKRIEKRLAAIEEALKLPAA